MRQQCSVCGTRDKDGGRDKGLLKLKPVMLELLGIKKDCTYYVCSCSYELEAVTLGKRRRWADDAKLNIDISDIVKEEDTESVAKDHAYMRDEDDDEEDDHSQRAVDLKMGSDEFNDSGLIDCTEETVEADTSARPSSQCSLSQSKAESEDSYSPSSQEESQELSQLSQDSSSAGRCLLWLSTQHKPLCSRQGQLARLPTGEHSSAPAAAQEAVPHPWLQGTGGGGHQSELPGEAVSCLC